MAVGREIVGKINSVKSTKKITSAMEMVAASKMRKAQDKMAATKPYAKRMREVIAHLANANPEYKHPYMITREVKRVGYIVVSSDRGLCGGLNANVFKKVVIETNKHEENNCKVCFSLIGNKAKAFFNSVGGDVKASLGDVGDQPELADIIGPVKYMLDAYESGELDALFLVYNEFVNTMTQQANIDQLLPLKPEEEIDGLWDYLYEPNAEEILDVLMERYIESQVYQSVVENQACEQAARMVAMKAATDNAGDLINELQTLYNKARQAAITQEISEIVGGAAAV